MKIKRKLIAITACLTCAFLLSACFGSSDENDNALDELIEGLQTTYLSVETTTSEETTTEPQSDTEIEALPAPTIAETSDAIDVISETEPTETVSEDEAFSVSDTDIAPSESETTTEEDTALEDDTVEPDADVSSVIGTISSINGGTFTLTDGEQEYTFELNDSVEIRGGETLGNNLSVSVTFEQNDDGGFKPISIIIDAAEGGE